MIEATYRIKRERLPRQTRKQKLVWGGKDIKQCFEVSYGTFQASEQNVEVGTTDLLLPFTRACHSSLPHANRLS